MYLNELVRLAREDNQALQVWVCRWMIRDGTDPIPDAFLLAKGIFWGFLGFIATTLTLAWIAFVLWTSYNVAHLGIVLGVFAFGAITMALIGLRIGSIKKRVKDKENCFDFLRMMSIIRDLHDKSQMAPFWTVASISPCGPLIYRYLRDQALELKRLERISWRAEEEKAFRQRFDKEFKALTRMGLQSPDRQDYFVDPPVTVSQLFERAEVMGG